MAHKLLASRAATTEAPRFVDTLRLDFLLLLELNGRQHPVPDVLAFRIVEHLDVIEHVLTRLIARAVDFPAYPLSLQQVEEALSHRVVMTVAPTAHRVNQIVVLEERIPVHAGELRALVRVDQHLTLRLAPP